MTQGDHYSQQKYTTASIELLQLSFKKFELLDLYFSMWETKLSELHAQLGNQFPPFVFRPSFLSWDKVRSKPSFLQSRKHTDATFTTNPPRATIEDEEEELNTPRCSSLGCMIQLPCNDRANALLRDADHMKSVVHILLSTCCLWW